jgi:hypothetical protein
MTITFIGKRPSNNQLVKVGNLGENNVDTIEFVIERTYRGIDLSTFTPTIEWARLAGGADFTNQVTKVVNDETISITWLLDNYFLNTAGKASCRIVLKNENTNETWISDIVNMYIAGGLDISAEIEKNYPENYRELWDNVYQIKEDIENGLLKGELLLMRISHQNSWLHLQKNIM